MPGPARHGLRYTASSGQGWRGSACLFAGFAGCASLLWCGYRWWRAKDGGGDLSGVVSFSSRLIASHRAVETESEAPLFHDPLASVLAGPMALARARLRAQAKGTSSPIARRLSATAVRTQWFDERILAALLPTERVAMQLKVSEAGCCVQLKVCRSHHIIHERPVSAWHAVSLQHAASGHERLAMVSVDSVLQFAPAANQCVMLGAGMDTRPWRLDLPAGVRWFEVDQSDVLCAKRAALEAAGARFVYRPCGRAVRQSPLMVSPPQGSGRLAQVRVYVQAALHGLLAALLRGSWASSFPLQSISWSGIAADLSQPGWLGQLVAQGLDCGQPILWVAEGLLMYLEQAAVVSLLQEAAAASLAGSRCLLMVVSDVALDRAQGSDSELLRTWRFGLAQADAVPFLKQCGWALQTCTRRAEFAHRYELKGVRIYVGQTSNDGSGSATHRDRGSLFIEGLAL